MSVLLLVLLTLPAQKPTVDTLFVKVGPYALVPGRSPKQDRAVVLIQGLNVTSSATKASKASLRSWQEYDSVLVKKLARDSDVYSLCYGQTIACDRISDIEEILDHIRGLKKAGYRQIVLIGHSAGGVVARHLVEDHPDLGITKVIQTCTPNTGSGWAGLKTVRPTVQAPFLDSLTISAREAILEKRKDKRIPANIEFTCVVASSRLGLGGDGVVSCKSAWSDDLQAQGIPAHFIKANHWDTIRSTGVDLIARLVKEPQKRWDARTVREMRKKLLDQ